MRPKPTTTESIGCGSGSGSIGLKQKDVKNMPKNSPTNEKTKAGKTRTQTMRMRVRDVNNMAINVMAIDDETPTDAKLTQNEYKAMLGLAMANRAFWGAISHRYTENDQKAVMQSIDDIIAELTPRCMDAKERKARDAELKRINDAIAELMAEKESASKIDLTKL